MRILKRKIELKQHSVEHSKELDPIPNIKMEDTSGEPDSTQSFESAGMTEFVLPMRKPRQKPPCPTGNSKNIVKNYGKALCAFATSSIAVPYLESLVTRNNWSYVRIPNFIEFIKSKKESINSIESLRRLLIPDDDDEEEVLVYKRLFKDVSIIFLKYFAVNWIFGGKLMHKNAHLKFRFKMLRRIQDPENFTYLKTSVK